jgi:uncharacterized protein (DUF2141 family)
MSFSRLQARVVRALRAPVTGLALLLPVTIAATSTQPLSPPVPSLPAVPPTAVTITVVVRGIEPSGGLLGAALFAAPDGFPKEHGRALQRERHAVRGAVDSLVFRNVPPGRYAIAVHHDLDGDGQLAENRFGVPREPWAVSRNLRPRFSAPKFGDAAIDVQADVRLELVVK